MFLLTSVVPPAIDSERELREGLAHGPSEGGEAEHVDGGGGQRLLGAGPGQLDHAALRLGGRPASVAPRDRFGQELEQAGVGVAGGEGLAGDGRVDRSVATRRRPRRRAASRRSSLRRMPR